MTRRAMNERFDAMNERFDERFDAMNERFDAMNERFDAILQRFDAMNDRFERKFDQVDERFELVDRRFDEMRALVATTERHILDRVEAMFDPHRDTPRRLNEIERHELATRVDALDEARLPSRVAKLEAKVFAPKRRATAGRRKRS